MNVLCFLFLSVFRVFSQDLEDQLYSHLSQLTDDDKKILSHHSIYDTIPCIIGRYHTTFIPLKVCCCNHKVLKQLPKVIPECYDEYCYYSFYTVMVENIFKRLHQSKQLDKEFLTIHLKSCIKFKLSKIKNLIEEKLKNGQTILDKHWIQYANNSSLLKNNFFTYSPSDEFSLKNLQLENDHLWPILLQAPIRETSFEQNYLQSIPKDVWKIIFSHLDPISIFRLSRVNAKFYYLSIVSYPYIIKYFLQECHFPSTIITKYAAMSLFKEVYTLIKTYPYLMECFRDFHLTTLLFKDYQKCMEEADLTNKIPELSMILNELNQDLDKLNK